MKQFRFHTGSIKSLNPKLRPTDTILFRFHTGSIKSESFTTLWEASGNVSIPYWFD